MKKAKKEAIENIVEIKEETKEEKTPDRKEKKSVGGFFWKLIFLFMIAGGGYYVWKNPQTIEKAKDVIFSISRHEVEIVSLKEDISGLNAEIERLRGVVSQSSSKVGVTVKDALAQVDEKYNAMEQYNMNIISSKADVALVLGVITRMDKAEERLDRLAKVSDDGALILSTAMLIKDRAIKGESFVLEAEVLNLLSEGKNNISPSVEVIVAFANGVDTDFALINSFNIVYNDILDVKEKAEGQTWQERIKIKLKELFRIKKRNAQQAEVKTQLDIAKSYAQEGKFFIAVKEIENAKITGFENWVDRAQKRIAFDNAVSLISAQSIAMMKVNNMKAKTANE